MSAEKKNYSDEDIRAAVNENSPQDAAIIIIGLMQRMAMALEEIAAQGRPQTMIKGDDAGPFNPDGLLKPKTED